VKEVSTLKVVIDVRVVFKTTFNVGSGALADSLADKPTVKDGAAMPILPGSSLKGRARHECERIVRSLTGNDSIVCHGPSAESMCPLDPIRLRLDDRVKACPVCQVFGSPWLPAAAQFPDLRWEHQDEFGEERPPDTMIRHGVSISRTRRVAEEQRLFTVETFAPTRETAFIGRIGGDFTDNDRERYGQVGLLVAGLRSITSLGGGRSRGTGWCRVEAKPAEILEGEELAITDGTLKEGLTQWLN
jgi:CRISPR/Cas system CSM-associated protein Csm3 (group 7 of RAMP superfamily)